MTLHFADDHLTVHVGDCRDILATLPAESVHCVVTSPPYWGLRDYGTATWEGGDTGCDHAMPVSFKSSTLGASTGGRSQETHQRSIEAQATPYREVCGKCGARRIDAQLGLEPTPEEYVANMVAVFREVRRVLRSDGTVWLNIGSSYASHDPGGYREGEFLNPDGRPAAKGSARNRAGNYLGRGSGSSRTRPPDRAPAYGSDGTGPQGSSGPGSACPDLCGECRAALSSRMTGTLRPQPVASPPRSPTDRGTEPPGFAPASLDASPLDAPASTSQRYEPPPSDRCSHCANCGACLSVTRSPSRDARLCAHKTGDRTGTGSPSGTSAAHTSGTASSGLAWGHYTSTIKPKDMVPIPWMVAMALQADGWYLRSEIIWSKPNPMPESVTDRPTKAHETVFLLSKRATYYYDADAVREAMTESSVNRLAAALRNGEEYDPTRHKKDARSSAPMDVMVRLAKRAGIEAPVQHPGGKDGIWGVGEGPIGALPTDLDVGDETGDIRQPGEGEVLSSAQARPYPIGDPDIARPVVYDRAPTGWNRAHKESDLLGRYDSRREEPATGNAGRNLRTVWTIATQPYPGAHFATFPEKLVEPCIKAGTSERGVCPECGAPWVRETSIEYVKGYRSGHLGRGRGDANGMSDMSAYPALDKRVATTGWHPSCGHTCEYRPAIDGTAIVCPGCGQEVDGRHALRPVPATVLDPFGGSGTTARVANRLGRRAILIDLSADYIDQAMLRNAQAPLGLLG